jgi:hypothetical protein
MASLVRGTARQSSIRMRVTRPVVWGGISLRSLLACLVTACGFFTTNSVQQGLARLRGMGLDDWFELHLVTLFRPGIRSG